MLIVVDVETAGTDPMYHALLTVGAVALDPEAGPVDAIEMAINDATGMVDPKALAINGLDPAGVRAQGLLPAVAAAELDSFVRRHVPEGKVTLAGHNVAFDAGFLRRLYRLADRFLDFDAIFSHRLIDLHSWYQLMALAGRLPRHSGSLDEIAASLGLVIEERRHTARGDAMLTARCLHRILTLVRSGAEEPTPGQ